MTTLLPLLLALLLLAILWLVAAIYHVGVALWHMQADLHDIRCSANALGEPAHQLLSVVSNKKVNVKREWTPEIHDGPNCFPD